MGLPMSNSAKKEYLEEIKKRYFLSSKSDKTLILDEFCTVCGFNRKYAIRIIRKKVTHPNRKKGRHIKYYSLALISFLKDLWVMTNLAYSKRLRAAIALWLPYYQPGNNNPLGDEDRKLLLEISPRTIDRLLHRLKSKYKKIGLSTAKPGSLLKKQVPINSINGMNLVPVLLRQIPLLIAVLLFPDSCLYSQYRRYCFSVD